MNVSVKKSAASATLAVNADEADLSPLKRAVFAELRAGVKADGFRPGKAPDHVVEQHLGSQTVQSEFLNHAINQLYFLAAAQQGVSPIGEPEIAIKKFVPYSLLEFTAEVEVMPPVKLADYKKFKVPLKSRQPTEVEIEETIQNIRRRTAGKKAVEQPAKAGDEVVIDFSGKDKDGRPVAGTEGRDLPILIGSKTFIPGFEDQLIGLKPGEKKTFELTFPKDYRSLELRGAKVKFDTDVKAVSELQLPELDDAFAAKVGPFKKLAELKADVERQLASELAEEAKREQRQTIVTKLIEGSRINVPPKMLERVKAELKSELHRSLHQRGQTEAEFYKQLGLTAEQYEKTELAAAAERRAKASICLSEVAKTENLTVERTELDAAIEGLKQRYQDNQAILDDLDKPQIREDIAMQILTDRTIDKLAGYAAN